MEFINNPKLNSKLIGIVDVTHVQKINIFNLNVFLINYVDRTIDITWWIAESMKLPIIVD